MTERDKLALENAARVLHAIADLCDAKPELASIFRYQLATPGGEEVRHFAHAAAAASGRNPTHYQLSRAE